MKDREKPKPVKQKKQRKQSSPRQLVHIPVLQKMVECPSCGEEIEVWADDEKSMCTWCGYQIITNYRQTH